MIRKLSLWKMDPKNNFLTDLMIWGEQAIHGISKNTKFVEFGQKKSIKRTQIRLPSIIYTDSFNIFLKISRVAKNIQRGDHSMQKLKISKKKYFIFKNPIFSTWKWIIHELSFLLRYIKISHFHHFLLEKFKFWSTMLAWP